MSELKSQYNSIIDLTNTYMNNKKVELGSEIKKSIKGVMDEFIENTDWIDKIKPQDWHGTTNHKLNIFQVGTSDMDVIGWLLNPFGSHDIGDNFLKRIMEKWYPSNNIKWRSLVNLEAFYKRCKYPDIFYMSEEDKVTLTLIDASEENPVDLSEYLNRDDFHAGVNWNDKHFRDFDNYYIVLIDEGAELQNADSFIVLKKDDIYDYIKEIISCFELKESVRIFLTDYLKKIKGEREFKDEFNIFDLESGEGIEVLSWLVDPHGSHGIGDCFLKKALGRLLEKNYYNYKGAVDRLLDLYSFEKKSCNFFVSKKEKSTINLVYSDDEPFTKMNSDYNDYLNIIIPYRDCYATFFTRVTPDNYRGLDAKDLYSLLKVVVSEREIKTKVNNYLENYIEYLEVFYRHIEPNKMLEIIENLGFKYSLPFFILHYRAENLLDFLSLRQIDYLNRFYYLLRIIGDHFTWSFPLMKRFWLIGGCIKI